MTAVENKLKVAYRRFFGNRRVYGDLSDAEIESVRRIEEGGWRVAGLLSEAKSLHGFYVGPQYAGGKRLNSDEKITRELLYVKPVDELDYIALIHDLEYSLASTVKDKARREALYREADRIFVKKLESLEINWGEVVKNIVGGAFFGAVAATHFESGNVEAGASALSQAIKAGAELLGIGFDTLKGFAAKKYFSNRLESGDTSYFTELEHTSSEIDDIIKRIMEVGMEEDSMFLYKFNPPSSSTPGDVQRMSSLPPPDTRKQQLQRLLKSIELLNAIE